MGRQSKGQSKTPITRAEWFLSRRSCFCFQPSTMAQRALSYNSIYYMADLWRRGRFSLTNWFTEKHLGVRRCMRNCRMGRNKAEPAEERSPAQLTGVPPAAPAPPLAPLPGGMSAGCVLHPDASQLSELNCNSTNCASGAVPQRAASIAPAFRYSKHSAGPSSSAAQVLALCVLHAHRLFPVPFLRFSLVSAFSPYFHVSGQAC